jgi:phosphohistidine phosphatase
MRQLLLLRHAHAGDIPMGGTDRDRGLDARGRAEAERMGRTMRERGYAPDVVLASSARRTLATLDGLGAWGDAPLIDHRDDLYLAEASSILSILRALPPTARCALLVGHNPGIHKAARRLAGETLADAELGDFPTCALAAFAVSGPWSGLGPESAGLERVLAPGR